MKTPMFSIVICSIDAGKFARISESYRHLFRAHAHEIIGIHDAGSLAEGYNRGLAQSRGDILIFSHDDILFLDDALPEKIRERMLDFDLLGFAGTDKLITATWFGAGLPHLHGAIAHAEPGSRALTLNVYGATAWPVAKDIQALDGCCLIARRALAERLGFDAQTFDGFHLYDLDFSFAAHLAGYRIGICCDIPILHESAGNFAKRHLHYAERFLLKYARQLGQTDPKSISGTRPGRGADFPDHQALRAAWRPEILQRATLAMYRAHAALKNAA